MKKSFYRSTAAVLAAGICTATLAGCTTGDAGLSKGTKSLTGGYETAAADTGAALEESFRESYADFALRLFQKSYDSGQNTMISPYSVMMALAMAANGAQGETLAQMERVLGGEAALEDLNGQLSLLKSRMPDGEGGRLLTANSIWYRSNDDNFEPREDFLSYNAKHYGAEIFAAEFDGDTLDDINRWVSEHTDSMIEDILDRIPEDALMYLINAVAFDAEWEDAYETNQIHDAQFSGADGTVTTVPMMYSEENGYLKEEHASGFIKPYREGYRFVALLPEEGMELGDYISQMSGEAFLETLANADNIAVKAGLPKFEAETKLELSKLLAALGMADAFDEEDADFSGMGSCKDGSNIYISRVIHQTHISVDELGTKAGAATAVEMVGEAAMLETEQVILDRPFVYAIVENESNLPVFIGAVDAIGE